MDKNKDYYGILGVVPEAEEVVIRAAYKALAGRYHPDKVGEDGNSRMIQLNEAWEVLSNREKRREYDQLRKRVFSSDQVFGDDTEDLLVTEDPLEEDWKFAVSYYNDLNTIEKRLRKISWRLAYSYKANMISEKNYDLRNKIAKDMENRFLESYFGTNKEVLGFAKKLIFEVNDKVLLKQLNMAIMKLGDSSPYPIIEKLENDLRRRDSEENKAKSAEADEKWSIWGGLVIVAVFIFLAYIGWN